MLDRIDEWYAYLADTHIANDEVLIKQHTRTGRLLGGKDFVQQLEAITGKVLTPK